MRRLILKASCLYHVTFYLGLYSDVFYVMKEGLSLRRMDLTSDKYE
jgi:hypothetical protein